MIRLSTLLMLCSVLVACGADGEPIQPAFNAGVSITPSGIAPTAGVGVQTGPFTLNLGIF